jgi:hypothetical protein
LSSSHKLLHLAWDVPGDEQNSVSNLVTAEDIGGNNGACLMSLAEVIIKNNPHTYPLGTGPVRSLRRAKPRRSGGGQNVH